MSREPLHHEVDPSYLLGLRAGKGTGALHPATGYNKKKAGVGWAPESVVRGSPALGEYYTKRALNMPAALDHRTVPWWVQ